MKIASTEDIVTAFGVFRELMLEENEKLFVKKDGAKVLSTNDFTDALKEKLDAITEEHIDPADIRALFES